MGRGVRVWAVLPARLSSSRLPRKVLADIHGRSMLEHVWRRTSASACFERVLVASDDDEVLAVASAFGADVVRAGPAPSGTARAALAVGDAPVAVVNVQADQPLLDPEHLRAVCAALAGGAEVATLWTPLTGDPADPARVKVQVEGDRARDFSRRPFDGEPRLHVGVYGFAAGAIHTCTAAPWSARARAEDLEQLAWMDAGVPITVARVGAAGVAVDTPADLAHVRAVGAASDRVIGAPNPGRG